MLPPERGSSRGGRPYLAHRHVMNGIFWVLCSGAENSISGCTKNAM
ncbi:hypothetical protein [Brenneria sp. L3-3C-1]